MKKNSYRILSVLCALAVLLSTFTVGQIRSTKQVKAVVGIDDVVMGVFFQITSYLAGLSAGKKSEDIVTSAESAGITNQASAEDYISSWTSNPNF